MVFYGFYGSRLVFHGFSWFQVGFSWFPMDFHDFSWLQVGFSWYRVDFHVFLWFSMGQVGFHGFSWFFMVPGQLEPPVSNEKVGVTKNEHFLKLSQEQARYNIFAIYLS